MNDFLTRLGNGKNHKGLSRHPPSHVNRDWDCARVVDCFLGDPDRSNSFVFLFFSFVRVCLAVAKKLMTGLISCRLVPDQAAAALQLQLLLLLLLLLPPLGLSITIGPSLIRKKTPTLSLGPLYIREPYYNRTQPNN